MAESTTVSIPDVEKFKQNALRWANRFRVVCLLDSNHYQEDKYSSRDWVLAIDMVEELLCTEAENAFSRLQAFILSKTNDVFGFLAYDLKNDIEKLSSANEDQLHFPELFFFEPRYLLEIKGNKVTVNRNYLETFHLIELIQNYKVDTNTEPVALELKERVTRDEYINNVETIREQIGAGDFYELNYCNEFYGKATIDPVDIFLKLNKEAGAPFSSFFKLDDKYVLCASPERFLKKCGRRIVSQPIKGTIRKGNTYEENEKLKKELEHSSKERAENVMVVDLVRNDLSQSATAGTVKVEELCSIYEFNTVNQMISTITAECIEGISIVDVVKNAFPMGSMTGAPKIEVMKNIERYEVFKRSIYSGSIGYINPKGDFDFNVVIRTILYNSSNKYVSIRVGGAITYSSFAEKEWEELLLKAQGLLAVLNAKIS